MSNFLKPEKVKAVIAHIEKGDGIRKTSRETGVSKNTVTKIQGVIITEKKKVHLRSPIVKKRGPKPKDNINRDRVYVDFTNYQDLYEMLLEEAEKEFRSLSMQLLYYVKIACDLKKK